VQGKGLKENTNVMFDITYIHLKSSLHNQNVIRHSMLMSFKSGT